MILKAILNYVLTFFFILNLGTPAARMKKVPSNVVKKRSRELTSVFEAFTPYNGMEGRLERIWITEIATDGIHLVRLGKCLNAFSVLLDSICASCILVGVKGMVSAYFSSITKLDYSFFFFWIGTKLDYSCFDGILIFVLVSIRGRV